MLKPTDLKLIGRERDKVTRKGAVSIRLGKGLSTHTVEERVTRAGNKYLLFTHVTGKTVMNYSKEDFRELYKNYLISRNTEMFLVDGSIHRIPRSYM